MGTETTEKAIGENRAIGENSNSSSVISEAISGIKRLAPLIRSAPVGERRTEMLRSLKRDLECIGKEGRASLEFVDLMNTGRFARAFGARPENLSKSFAAITYNSIGDNAYIMDSDVYGVGDGVAIRWPKFDAKNEENAKAFIGELVERLSIMIAGQSV